jgi:hypothetical protein
MKARAKQLLDQASAAMLAGIEIYNKPRFTYRAQSFAILALNGWELLLKAKWLTDSNNRLGSLYVRQGSGPRRRRIKKTRAGNPMTHSLDYLAEKLRENRVLAENVCRNLQILTELRDSAVHFYYDNSEFEKRLHEIGAAAVTNFYAALRAWFKHEPLPSTAYFMPLAFVSPKSLSATNLTSEEKRVLKFISAQMASAEEDPGSPYAVAVNLELRFVRSKSEAATPVRVSNDPDALPVRLSEEDVLARWPWTYDELTSQCRKRYSDFKADHKYHELRKALASKPAYAHLRLLNPKNPAGARKMFFNPNILQELDKHYQRRETQQSALSVASARSESAPLTAGTAAGNAESEPSGVAHAV